MVSRAQTGSTWHFLSGKFGSYHIRHYNNGLLFAGLIVNWDHFILDGHYLSNVHCIAERRVMDSLVRNFGDYFNKAT